ncbi:MAG: two-component regulator propeller domain-containing protein [Bacteroidota bacterium]|nr:two-component regulator propeller domain-containing protein [Bacteroidota bacterium]MDP3146110.1 two-component regulator propeller domain-containing protein [Bacteroidota bacterium]
MCLFNKLLYFFLFFISFISCNTNSVDDNHSRDKKHTGAESVKTQKYNPVSLHRAVSLPVLAGLPKVLNVSTPIVLPTNTNVHLVGEPKVVFLPKELPTTTLRKDTSSTPKVVPANGKEIFCKQPVPVIAATPRFKDATIYNLQYLDVDQGMNSPYVRSILNDKNGNLWFGTKAGVSRYDGRSFFHYTEKEGLSNSVVLSMLEDKAGNIWFGTEGGGACCYNGKTFIRFSEKEGLSNNTVLSIIQDKKGNIWFGTNGGGVCSYDGKSFTYFTEREGLCNNSVRGILEDKNGNIWFGTNGGGLSRYDGKTLTTFSEDEGLSNNIVLSMFEDKNGNLWFGTDEGGVNLFDGKSFSYYTEYQGLSNNSVLSIFQDKIGNLWFGTYSGGANKFDGKTFTYYTENEGLSNNYVSSIQEDNAGNLWFGTYGGGVNRYDEKLFMHYTNKEGLGNNTVRAILEDKTGKIWFGTYGDGIMIYDGKSFAHYNVSKGLSSNYIKAILLDKHENLWFATDGGGVIKYDGKSFLNYTEEQGLCSDYILSLLEDGQGNVWFGSDGNGVSRFDGKFFTTFSETEGLCNNTVLCMMKDNQGTLWLGTDGGGACRFDGVYFTYYTKKQGLSSNYINTIFQDSKGTIWFGTDGEGLCGIEKNSLESGNLKFIRFTENEGLSNNDVNSILEDKAGGLWLGTENGLNYFISASAKIKQETSKNSSENSIYEALVYSTTSGLKANNFFNKSSLIDSKNNIWWGTGKALSTLNLNTFKLSTEKPLIQLNNIELEQTFIDFYALKDSLKSGNPMFVGDEIKKSLKDVKFDSLVSFYNYPKNLQLPYHINHITFQFSAIDWSAPNKIHYQYMLEGIDKDWSPLTKDNRALYSNLSNGEYVFNVRAIGLSQQWSDILKYKFVINPPWWKTWLAYFLYMIMVSTLIYCFINIRTAQLRVNQKKLEVIVAERTAEVVEQKELIEEKQKEIVDSINYAQRIQRALLASDELLNTNLKNYFLFFKPKDIVSGDFYWASHLVNGDFALVTADSTGHGVPGAMMSMLNISCLNEAINERKLKSPAEILNHARKRIIESLAQDGSVEGGKDGMDCSVIAFDFKNNKITYSSANNPIWILRQTEKSVELIDLKGDRMPVGKHHKDATPFNNHTVNLIKGDVIYTLTDGFADQFGGSKGKKFKHKQLQDILISSYGDSMEGQKQKIEDAFNNWKGNLEQIDDVCIIGVRF